MCDKRLLGFSLREFMLLSNCLYVQSTVQHVYIFQVSVSVCVCVTHTIKIIHAIKIRIKNKIQPMNTIFYRKEEQIVPAINSKYSQTSLKRTHIECRSLNNKLQAMCRSFTGNYVWLSIKSEYILPYLCGLKSCWLTVESFSNISWTACEFVPNLYPAHLWHATDELKGYHCQLRSTNCKLSNRKCNANSNGRAAWRLVWALLTLTGPIDRYSRYWYKFITHATRVFHLVCLFGALLSPNVAYD